MAKDKKKNNEREKFNQKKKKLFIGIKQLMFIKPIF